jgi:GNAT superfamily N-acetyltransferase
LAKTVKGISFSKVLKDNSNQYDIIHTFWHDYFDETEDTSPENMLEKYLYNTIMEQDTHKGTIVELCFIEDEAAGFCSYSPVWSSWSAHYIAEYKNFLGDYAVGKIFEYYVAREFRKRGIGQMMFEHCKNECEKKGAQKLVLIPLRNAESFWKYCSFKDTGRKDSDNNLPIYVTEIEKD